MKMDLKGIVESANNSNAKIAVDGIQADVAGFIDTGSYALNALLSGTIYGGVAANKITGFAGEHSTGKTFFALAVARQWLMDNPEGYILYFDSEDAVTTQMLDDREIDKSRVATFPVATIEQFRHQAYSILEKYAEEPEDKSNPIFIILDSLGNLSTTKEMGDIAEGKDTRDMTRAQVIRGTFRVLTIKLGEVRVPMLLTNHTYAAIGTYVPMREMSGGSGLKYAASTVLFLSSKKERDGKDVIGTTIHCKTYKSRFTKENQMIDVSLNYTTGLNRYYGLADLAVEFGIFKKLGKRLELPDGSKMFEKKLYSGAKKYFTQEILDAIDKAAGKKFRYGSALTLDEAEAELDAELKEEAGG